MKSVNEISDYSIISNKMIAATPWLRSSLFLLTHGRSGITILEAHPALSNG
jgi:hypothetical protein